MSDSIESNVTGARIAEEATPGVLPATPVWHPVEPNSYNDFGGQITTKARKPINPTRQRKKGSTTDLDASGGFNQDFTETGLLRLMQGFCFADADIPGDTQPIDGSASVVLTTAVNADSSVNAAAGLDVFSAGDIVLLSGFGVAANNGVKNVATAAAGKLTFTQAITDEGGLPASARIRKIGQATTDLAISVAAGVVTVTSATEDFLTWPIVEGSWLFFGSDANAFAAPGNACFARVDSITSGAMVLGKTSKQMVAEAAGPAVDVMLPVFVRNQPDEDNIVKRTYQIERTLGRDANGVMSEYLVQSVPNELTINVPTADLMTADLSFVSADAEQRNGATGVKPGTRPVLGVEDAYNTSSDVKRFKLAVVTDDAYPTALFGYAEEMTITVNNNVTPNKAIGVLGAFAMTAGTFDVGGSMTVYFNSVDAVQAVRNNTDVTLDLVLVKDNAGWVFDLPLVALGDGRANVEADQPIKLPLENMAAESDLGHTLMVARFEYLPDLAA